MRAIFLGIVTLTLLSLSRPAEARRRKPPADAPASTEGAQEAGAATATGPEAPTPGAEATQPCSEDDLNQNVGRGLGAWESWSDKTWTRALSDVRVSLACQGAPVSPDTAANLRLLSRADVETLMARSNAAEWEIRENGPVVPMTFNVVAR